jgi:hypothetical protein
MQETESKFSGPLEERELTLRTLSYISLPTDEEEKAGEWGRKLGEKIGSILKERKSAKFGVFGLFVNVTTGHGLYDGCVGIIDIWSGDPFDIKRSSANRLGSYGVYPDGLVINRPNLWIYEESQTQEGEYFVQVIKDIDPKGKENYQVGSEEIKGLILLVRHSQ